MLRLLLVAVLLLGSGAAALGQPAAVNVEVPLTVKALLGERTVTLAAFEYKPEGSGPFPAIVQDTVEAFFRDIGVLPPR